MIISSQVSKKQLSIIAYTAFFLMVSILCLPKPARASVIYNQSTDNLGSIVVTAGVNTYSVEDGGTFTISAPVTMLSSSTASTFIKKIAYPSGGYHVVNSNIYIASTTASNFTGNNYYVDFNINKALENDGLFHSEIFTVGYIQYADLPAGTYHIIIQNNNGAGDSFAVEADSSDINFYGNITNEGVYAPTSDFTTRIMSTIPADTATIPSATPETMGASVYVNPAQYNASEYVEMSFYRNQDTQGAVSNPQLITTTYDFPVLTASGETDVSTTTPILTDGQYTLTTSLRQTSMTQNILNFFGFGIIGDLFSNANIITQTTSFTVGTPTAYDTFVASTTEAINSFVASSTINTASCTTFSSFNFLTCMSLIFTWQTAPMNAEMSILQNTLFSYAPWGYVTRTMAILETASSTPIPAVSYTFPADFPAPLLANFTMTFDPWNYFGEYQNFKSDTSGTGLPPEDAWQIMMPLFTAFCWLWTAWLIFKDLLKLEHGRSEKSENDNDGKRRNA